MITDNKHFTTLRTFNTASEAYLWKSKLESEGIAAYIFDEHMVTLNPLLSVATGGIKLKIDSEDYEQANAILQQGEQTRHYDEEGQLITCPRCGSDDLYAHFISFKSFFATFAWILSLFTGTYPLHFHDVYKCKDCNKEF